MPIYEYHCHGCGHIFEALRAIRDRDNVALCPECGAFAGRILSPIAHAQVWPWVPHPAGSSHEPIREIDEERLERKYKETTKGL